MKEAITFADVLITPKFSTIESRKDVDLGYNGEGLPYVSLPILSANMDTITESKLARVMISNGAQAVLHRFQSIQDNVQMFLDSSVRETGLIRIPMVSIGLGDKELQRAEALVSVGATYFVVDVAHGASMGVVRQVRELRKLFKDNISITVGNFATGRSVIDFLEHTKNEQIQGVKVGVGPGAICATRIVTGAGFPQLSAIMEISDRLKNSNITIIADGGMSTSGDCAKALGAGAHLLMSGTLFSGCEETPGETLWKDTFGNFITEDIVYPKIIDLKGNLVIDKNYKIDLPAFKKYRGSASKESYEAQGKTASHRAPEGEEIIVPFKGPVKDVLQHLEGGLRSAFTYTNSRNLEEFHRNVEFVKVSPNTVTENGIRGSKK
jgi:IMP dehydrogenase